MNYTHSPGRARMRILATSDLHMALTSHDFQTDRVNPAIGLTRTASLIAMARDDAAQDGALTLLFDNGDGMQGSAMDNLAVDRPDRPHPLMRAFAHLRYDAVGLGNHDFNYGLNALDAALNAAPCPVICSNLRRIDGRKAGFAPFAVLERVVKTADNERPIRIGVLSFVPPQTVTWDAHLLRDVIEAEDIIDSARRLVPQLCAAGCDLIVALSHSGLASAEAEPGMENASIPLAALNGIDAVIAGHTHLHLPGIAHQGLKHVDAEIGSVHGKPVVMPGSAGSHLGVIDLDLAISQRGQWSVDGFAAGLHAIARRDKDGHSVPLVEEDPALLAILAEDVAETRTLMEQPVGHSAVALHSYFTFFARDRSLALIAAAQAAALRPLIAATEAAGLPMLSAVAPGRFGGRAGPDNYTDIPVGPLTKRHLAALNPFPNDLCAVIMSGQQVLDWLEMSACIFRQIAPGDVAVSLLDPAIPGHDFDILHGLSWRIDLSAPPRFHRDGSLRNSGSHRIRDARWQGCRVAVDQQFVVALNSYRTGGGGYVAALQSARPVNLPGRRTIRAALCNYLTGSLPGGPLEATPPDWEFVGMPDASACVATGPGALAHMGELTGRGITVGGRDADGFLQLMVPL